MTFAYLGPPGTFSEEALLEVAGGERAATEGVPVPTVRDAILAVHEQRADRALVPIESATEGSVDETLDTLAVEAPGVVVVRELVRRVEHHLVAAAPLELAEVAEVASHPQALGQCAAFLRHRLRGDVRLVSAASTADAVRDAAGARAAIGTRRAATLYDRAVLASGIEDNPENVTRFVVLAPAGTPLGPGADKTSLVFWGGGATEPGWLVRCLSEFAFRGVNLSRIESRPRRGALGAYMFFLDCAGATGEERVDEALAALQGHCDVLRVLGSYPSGS